MMQIIIKISGITPKIPMNEFDTRDSKILF